MCWPEAAGILSGLLVWLRLTVRVAGIEGTRLGGTLDLGSPVPSTASTGWLRVICDHFQLLWYPGWSGTPQKLFLSSS